MKLYTEEKRLINKAGSDERNSRRIYESKEMNFDIGERIVSAKVTVEKEDRYWALSMEFLVYQAL